MDNTKLNEALAVLRISIGSLLLWAFFDKLIGLGFSTCRNAETHVIDVMCDSAWLSGGSPTFGFLKFGTKGPLQSIFSGMATSGLVEWLFMLGLLVAGVTLVFGIAVRFGAIVGILLFALMYLALLFPEHNPIFDDHIIYIIALIAVLYSDSGKYLGFGKCWSNLNFVKDKHWLK